MLPPSPSAYSPLMPPPPKGRVSRSSRPPDLGAVRWRRDRGAPRPLLPLRGGRSSSGGCRARKGQWRLLFPERSGWPGQAGDRRWAGLGGRGAGEIGTVNAPRAAECAWKP